MDTLIASNSLAHRVPRWRPSKIRRAHRRKRRKPGHEGSVARSP